MRPFGSVLAVVLAALAVSAAVAFAVGDRRTFVPAPDAEAESFARTLAMGRVDRARTHLSDDLRQKLTADELRRYGRRISSGPGTVWDVRGETEWVAGDRSSATVSLRGRGSEKHLRLVLLRERGLWRVAGIETPE